MLDPAVHRALYGAEPRHHRAGSGTHHKHAVPRKETTRLLATALANFEVGHYAAADRAAQELVSLLHSKLILQQAPKLPPNTLEKLDAEKDSRQK